MSSSGVAQICFLNSRERRLSPREAQRTLSSSAVRSEPLLHRSCLPLGFARRRGEAWLGAVLRARCKSEARGGSHEALLATQPRPQTAALSALCPQGLSRRGNASLAETGAAGFLRRRGRRRVFYGSACCLFCSKANLLQRGLSRLSRQRRLERSRRPAASGAVAAMLRRASSRRAAPALLLRLGLLRSDSQQGRAFAPLPGIEAAVGLLLQAFSAGGAGGGRRGSAAFFSAVHCCLRLLCCGGGLVGCCLRVFYLRYGSGTSLSPAAI